MSMQYKHSRIRNILFSDSCRSNCWGGVEKWVVMMASQLQQKGYATHLVCRPGSLLEKAALETGLAVHHANFYNSLDLSSISHIYTLICQEKIDLIICSTNLDIKLAGFAGRLASVPVISRQGLALIPNNLKYRFIIKYLTTSIITNTKTIKQQYEAYTWFPKNHIQVIYNGVLSTPPTIKSRDLRGHLSIAPNEKLILSAGRLNPQKGFQYLIEAAQMAQTTNKPWKFIILGDGQSKQQLQNQIDTYRLRNIRLLGFQNNICDFYVNADLFVLSSLSEGIPNVVLEAMISHCPVIATDVNGIGEVIENGKNGWIIPAQNSRAIFQAIEKYIDQPELLKQITIQAHQTVANEFTIEKSSDKLSEYITHIIEKYEKDHHKNA